MTPNYPHPRVNNDNPASQVRFKTHLWFAMMVWRDDNLINNCRNRIHRFDNGLSVYQHHLIELQRERYRQHNVHEAEEEPVFLRVLEDLPKSATFVNVGAAIGYYAILAKCRRPDLNVIAYEPLRRHRRYFRQNLRLNGLRRRDIRIESEGVNSQEGEAHFLVQDFSSMIHRSPVARGLLSRVRSVFSDSVIATITLTTLLHRAGGYVDMLQMDIQGLELPVVGSSRSLLDAHCVRTFLVGTHSLAIHEELEELFSNAGYTIEVSEPRPVSQPDGILLATTPARQ